MQTRTYGDLFKITSALIGTGGELDVSEQDQVSHFINRRFQQAFDESPVWPRYLVSSEGRHVSSFITSGVADTPSVYNRPYYKYGIYTHTGTSTSNFYVPVNQDDATNKALFIYKNAALKWVWGTGAYNQIAIGKDAINIASVTGIWIQSDSEEYDDPSQVLGWGSVSGAVAGTPSLSNVNLISYAETVETSDSSLARVVKNTIGDFNRIHRKQAFRNNSSLEYEFFVDFDGANILNIANSTDGKAFVSYKKQFTPFTVTSDYYNSTAEVPGEFFNYIAHAVYADFLRVQNRQQEAIAEEQVAQTYLALELEKIDIRSNNNTINKRFSTYVNRQSR